MKLKGRPARVLILTYVLAALAIVGITGQALAQEVVQDARAALPKAIRDAGVLKVATNLNWAPFDYQSDAGQAVGIDISLIKILAAKLGLKASFDDMAFPSIIPGVTSGRYDVGVDQIGITPDRLKVIDLIPYFDSGYALLVPKGRVGIDINNLCGRTLAVTEGSAQIAVAQDMSKKCVAAGKPSIGLQYYQNSSDTFLAVSNGRGDGYLTAEAVGVYISKINPKLVLAPGTLVGLHVISGIAIAKGRDDLYKALLLAFESSVADGSYMAMLGQFGVPDGGLTLDQIRTKPTN